MTDRGFHRYFRPKHGRWRGDYRFVMTDVRALSSSSMGFFDRAMFASLALLCRLLGPMRIETSVDTRALDRGRVLHTTRVSKWGVALQVSEETFELRADGERFDVTGWLTAMPLFWVRRSYIASSGVIDDPGNHASYEFRWGGARIAQKTRPHEAGLDVTQETDGCRGEFVLRQTQPALVSRSGQ